MTLPPLPPGSKALEFIGSTVVYSWAEITAYGEACALAGRERRAKQLDALGCDHCAAAIRSAE